MAKKSAKSIKLPATFADAANSLTEGGLPQIIAGPAGKAICRLIGAMVEVPAAWFEQHAQSTRDQTKARSKIMEVLSKKSAELGMSDPALLERGLNNLIGRAYREQTNRDAIALKTIEHLKDEPPPVDGKEPSDEWLDIFEEYASKASSEGLRDVFSRVLAGEIRNPGNFSRSTMHLVSVLDTRNAGIIEKIAPHVWAKKYALRTIIDVKIRYLDLLELEEIGFLTLGMGSSKYWMTAADDGFCGISNGDVALMIEIEPGEQMGLTTYIITRSGTELLDVLKIPPDTHAGAKALWQAEPKPKGVYIASAAPRDDGHISIDGLHPIPEPNGG